VYHSYILADFEKYAGGVEKVLEQIKTIFDIDK